MNKLLLAASVLLVLGLRPADAQTSVWVSSTFGSDQPSAGTPTQPFATLAYALANAPAGPIELNLYPGLYTEALGEVFPLVLRPFTVVQAVVPGAAYVKTTPTQVLPDAFVLPAGTVQVLFRGIEATGNSATIRIDAAAGDTPTIDLEDCRITGGFGLHCLSDQAVLALNIRDSEVSGANAAVRLVADNGSATLAMDRVYLRGSAFQGVDLVARNGGTASLVADHVVFYKAGRNGLRTNIDPGAVGTASLTHCVFHDNGGKNAGSSAINEIQPSAQTTSFTIQNCVFWGNADDLKKFHAGYVLSHCIMEFPRPGTAILNQDPLFLDAAANDYHLAPGSPAIDAGFAGISSTDIDGDPIPDPQSFAADIGIDEFYPRHAHVNPARLRLLVHVDLHVVGPSGSFLFLAFSASPPQGFFGSGFRLGPQLFPLLPVGTIPASGKVKLDAGSFSDPALIGVPIWGQAGFFDPSGATISWSDNVFPIRFDL